MSETPDWRDQRCRRCRHLGNDHDAGECWATVDGAQCTCGGLDLPTPTVDVAAEIARGGGRG